MRRMMVKMVLLCLFMASGAVAHAGESGLQADALDQQMVLVPGGSWLYVAEFLRTSFRFNADPSGQQFGYGFRCAKTP